jgi:hypothetical protein
VFVPSFANVTAFATGDGLLLVDTAAEFMAESVQPGDQPADRVTQALTDTADLLDSLVDQTLAIMNDGGRLDDAIFGVVPPAKLMDRPYLKPVYDEPEFIVRNVWRLYGGWLVGRQPGEPQARA